MKTAGIPIRLCRPRALATAARIAFIAIGPYLSFLLLLILSLQHSAGKVIIILFINYLKGAAYIFGCKYGSFTGVVNQIPIIGLVFINTPEIISRPDISPAHCLFR